MALGDKKLRMQRVRVGLTGLAAVLVVVAGAAAVLESASNEPQVSGDPGTKNQAAAAHSVENMIANVEAVPNEPLAEIGVAPGSGLTDVQKAAQNEAAAKASAPEASPPS